MVANATTPFHIAREYLRRGWQPVPVPYRSKGPVLDDWQMLRTTEDELPQYFNGAQSNIGVLLGVGSDGLTDIDLDCAEAIRLARYFLPASAYFGRKSKPASHILYKAHGELRTRKFQTKMDGTILEIRATSAKGTPHQTVFPGSVHESGEEIVWHDPSDPVEIDAAELTERATDLAVATLLLRHWPSAGCRHDASLALAGGLARGGVSLERAQRIMHAIAEATGCDDMQTKLRNLTDTYSKLAGDNEATGWPTLAKLIGKEPVAAGRQWLGVGGIADADAVGDVVEHADPLPLADHFIDARYRDDDGRLLVRRWHGDFYETDGRRYITTSDEAVGVGIYRHLETLWTPKRNRTTGEVERNEQGKARLVRIQPNRWLMGEVRVAMPSRGLLVSDHIEPPCWLDGEHTIDARELVPCTNGLLHPPTRELHPLTPDYFALHALDYAYQPDAPEPTHWLTFLHDDLWPGDDDAVVLLQEWFAYVLTLNLTLHKMLLLVGPKRSGKGTIARVLTAMLGRANVCGPTLSSLTERFGLEPLLHKQLAIISDARLSGRADSAIVAERLLAVSGEDSITIDRKHRTSVDCTLPTRFMLLSNELPRIADSSGALASRFMVLTLKRSFYGSEDTGLTKRLLAELPGILNWALAGWDRLHEQDRFTEPQSSADAIEELADLGSPVSAFIRECCELGEGLSVQSGELFDAWKEWCASVGRDHTGDKAGFGRQLRSAVPHVGTSNPLRTSAGRMRFYEGITLKGGENVPI